MLYLSRAQQWHEIKYEETVNKKKKEMHRKYAIVISNAVEYFKSQNDFFKQYAEFQYNLEMDE